MTGRFTNKHAARGGFVLLAASVTIWIGYAVLHNDCDPVCTSSRLGMPQDCIAEGIRFEEYVADERLFSLKVDAIRVVAEKVGFLRLGFLRRARLENVCLDFYEDAAKQNGTNMERNNGLPDLGHVLSDDGLKLVAPKKISTEISNIKMNIYRSGRIILALSSDEAEVESGARELTFRGHVRITSGEKVLESEQIIWLRDERRFHSSDLCRLRVGGRVLEGKGPEADYLLKQIAPMALRHRCDQSDVL